MLSRSETVSGELGVSWATGFKVPVAGTCTGFVAVGEAWIGC